MMRAYLRARRIAVVPEATYLWMVRPKATRTSITHGRANVQNLLDRMAVNERIDALIADEGADDIKPWKDRKFLRHDLKMYLQDLWRRDPQYQQTFTEVVGGYLKTIPDEVLLAEAPLVRITLWLLRQGDLEGALSAYGYVLGRGRVASPLVQRDGRVYWTERYLDTEEGRRWLDVTDLGLDRVPPPSMHLYNELEFVGGEGGQVVIEGSVLNQLGVVPETADVKIHVVVKPRRGGRPLRFAAGDVQHAGDCIKFGATLDLGQRVTIGLRRTQLWDVYVETAWAGQVNLTRTAASAEAWPDVAIAVASRRALLVGDTLRPYGTLVRRAVVPAHAQLVAPGQSGRHRGHGGALHARADRPPDLRVRLSLPAPSRRTTTPASACRSGPERCCSSRSRAGSTPTARARSTRRCAGCTRSWTWCGRSRPARDDGIPEGREARPAGQLRVLPGARHRAVLGGQLRLSPGSARPGRRPRTCRPGTGRR